MILHNQVLRTQMSKKFLKLQNNSIIALFIGDLCVSVCELKTIRATQTVKNNSKSIMKRSLAKLINQLIIP